MLKLQFTGLIAASALCTAACEASPPAAPTANADWQGAPDGAGGNVQDQVPINQRFGSLDEYLAFIERTQRPVDGPWYRQIRPGVYELQTGGNLKLDGGNPPNQVFTREQLEQKFGFSE